MKFEKRLHSELQCTLPDWRDKYLSYKQLKKRLKLLSASDKSSVEPAVDAKSSVEPAVEVAFYVVPESESKSPVHADVLDPSRWTNMQGDQARAVDCSVTEDCLGASSSPGHGAKLQDPEAEPVATSMRSLSAEEADFIHLLYVELDKLNTFFMEKEEEYVIRLQEIKGRLERVQETIGSNGMPFSDSDINEIIEIRKDVVNIHGEIVLLKHYSSLNYTGLVKILKKHDKRTGALLQWPFIKVVLHEPFFTTDILSELVRECEVNLQFLFPHSSIPIVVPERGSEYELGKPGEDKDTHPDAAAQGPPSFLGDDIYRSTVAALRTMKELGKGSSTYNVFSIPPFSQSECEEGWSRDGRVTAPCCCQAIPV